MVHTYILQVDSEYFAGEYEEARRASMITKRLNYVSMGFGTCIHLTSIFIAVIYVIIVVTPGSG